MSISSRISSMEEHVTNAYNGLQGLGADLTGIDKNIDNIASVLDDIYNDLPKVTGNGTSITLDDTRKGRLESTLSGNTSQFTTTGKNLFNIEGRYETGTGIEYTKNSDGSYTLNGTANGNNFLRGLCYLNEQHTISYTSSDTNNNVLIRTRTGTPSAQTGIQDQMAVTSTSGNLTSSKQFDFVEISIVSGTTLNNFKIYIQLEKGSSVTSFEPYTGGNPAPNPSYPQPVNVVSGDNEIVVCGKNICFTDFGDWESGEYNSSGDKGNNTSRVRIKDLLIVRQSTTYFLDTSSSNDSFIVREYDKNKTFIKSDGIIANGGTITTMSNCYFLGITLFSNTNQTRSYDIYQTLFEESSIKPFICLNSVSNKTYEPYIGNTYNIDLPEGMELCSSQDKTKKDGFLHDKTTDKWYLHKEMGKYIFGSTNLTYDSTYNRAYTNVSSIINNILIPTSNSEALNGLSNYFSILNATTFLGNTSLNGLAISSTGTLSLRNTSYTTQTDYNNWLSTNKPILYYALATSTNTEITYQPLIDQLNLLEKAMSKNGQTNISQVNNDLPFIISASALKKWSE